jgi:hypothetical protein
MAQSSTFFRIDSDVLLEFIYHDQGNTDAYEIEVDGERQWLTDEQILYIIDTEFEDDINNYFEIIFDKDGIHMIPKKLGEITILDEFDELKSMEFSITGERHKKVTFHVGDTDIWSSDKPKPEEEKEPNESKKHRII